MKTSLLRTFAKLGLGAVLGSITLLAQTPLSVVVPFNFTVGKTTLAAGDYRVRQITPMVLQIARTDGKTRMMVATHPGDPTTAPGVGKLVFTRYGDQYFLSAVYGDTAGWELPKSVLEKEIIAKARTPKSLAVVTASPGR